MQKKTQTFIPRISLKKIGNMEVSMGKTQETDSVPHLQSSQSPGTAADCADLRTEFLV